MNSFRSYLSPSRARKGQGKPPGLTPETTQHPHHFNDPNASTFQKVQGMRSDALVPPQCFSHPKTLAPESSSDFLTSTLNTVTSYKAAAGKDRLRNGIRAQPPRPRREEFGEKHVLIPIPGAPETGRVKPRNARPVSTYAKQARGTACHERKRPGSHLNSSSHTPISPPEQEVGDS